MNTASTLLIIDHVDTNMLDSWSNQPASFLPAISSLQLDQLADFIFDQLQDKDGSPEINNIRIGNFVWSKEKSSGHFRVHFEINRRFCCSDICASGNDYIDFQFRLEGVKMICRGSYFDWTLNN